MRMHEIMEQVRIAKMTETDPWTRTVRDWGLPLRDWFDAGLVVTGGSDNPAVVYNTQQPFLGQYAALTGNTLAGVLLPGQTVTREENAAHVHHQRCLFVLAGRYSRLH